MTAQPNGDFISIWRNCVITPQLTLLRDSHLIMSSQKTSSFYSPIYLGLIQFGRYWDWSNITRSDCRLNSRRSQIKVHNEKTSRPALYRYPIPGRWSCIFQTTAPKQSSLAKRSFQRLGRKFIVPFPIGNKISPVKYKLSLLHSSKIILSFTFPFWSLVTMIQPHHLLLFLHHHHVTNP